MPDFFCNYFAKLHIDLPGFKNLEGLKRLKTSG